MCRRAHSPTVFGNVVLFLKATQYRVLLEKSFDSGGGIEIVCCRRSRERGVGVAHELGVKFGIGTELCCVGGLLRIDMEGLAAVPRLDEHFTQAIGMLGDREEVTEDVKTVNKRFLPVRHDINPRGAVCNGLLARRDDAEVFRLPVGAQDPAPVQMLGLVLVIALPRYEYLK